MNKNFSYFKNSFTGIPCGLANQECPLPWTVLLLSHQIILYFKYPYYSPISPCFQSLRYLTDVVCEICWKFFRQSVGCLVRCWGWPCLSHRRVVLLPVATGNARTRFGRSTPCRALHLFYVGLLRLFLKNLDRCIRIIC